MGSDALPLASRALLAAALSTLSVWLVLRTEWYATALLTTLLALAAIVAFAHRLAAPSRELARWLDGLRDDAPNSDMALTHTPLGPALHAASEALRAHRAAAEAERAGLAALVETVPTVLLAIDESGRVRALNRGARQLLRRREQALADLGRVGVDWPVTLAALQPGGRALLRATDGRRFAALGRELRVGGVRSRLISLQDIRLELEATETGAWAELVRVLAHEINSSLTPIASLSASIQPLLAEAREGADAGTARTLEEAELAMEVVARRSAGLMRFVDGYRRVAQVPRPVLRRVEVATLFAHMTALFAPEAARRSIAWRVDVRPPDLSLQADGDLLEQALVNLIRNGFEALSVREHGEIALEARIESGFMRLSVLDDGPGFADEPERLFVPFFTTKQDGSGIGLSLVRQIALVHGGTAEAATRPSGGALLTLALPLGPATQPALPSLDTSSE
jgi:two-component system, NtrC family, nitrogen regulation sensor histidine kinase NtrY